MIKDVIHDPIFLAGKSEMALKKIAVGAGFIGHAYCQ